MSDEDHKLTVETETVEAPGASLLPSTTQPQSITTNDNQNENDNITTATMMTTMSNSNNNNNNNINSNSNNINGNNPDNNNDNDNSNDINDSGSVIPNNSVSNNGVSNNTNANTGSNVNIHNPNVGTNYHGPTPLREMSPAHFASSYAAAAHAAANAAASAHQPSSTADTSFNLIDHNPLSPHAIQSLKNKKSSLLINNDGGKKDVLPNNVNPSTSEISRRNRNDDLETAKMGTAGATPDQRVSQSSHSSKAVAVPPPPSKQNANQAGPPMIQRPSLPLMNSREILLENEKYESSGNKSKDNKEHEGVPTNAQVPNSDNVASPSHAEEDSESLNKPTKADFFAARLASAVGENEVSDSEETFIYESAANSTKNAVSGGGNISISDNNHNKHPDLAQHGVTSKMSVPVLNNNAKLLNRLKNTRHTSLSALPANASMSFAAVAPSPSPIANTGAGITTHPSTDDLNSVNSFARQNQKGAQDLQSVKSFSSEPRSPDKRMSLVSLAKGNSTGAAQVPSAKTNTGGPQQQQQQQQQPQFQQFQSQHPPQQLSRKPSLSNSTLRHVSVSHMGGPRVKPEPPGFKRKLRTTASKIFDSNGAPLRRYSGLPDDVNLEDYIEQYPNQDTKRLGHDLGGVDDQQSTIQEEEEAIAAAAAEYGGDVDEDDIHSMFFYNHRGNLESRPPISDYEEDGEDLENNNNNANNNNNNNNTTTNTNTNNTGGGSTTYLNASYGGTFPYTNEYTPLKPRKHQSRTPLGYSPHNFYTRKTSWVKFKNFLYFSSITFMLLTVGFVLGFLLASNKELEDFNIVLIDNVLSSADELVFDVTVSALNPGFLSIDVQNMDLDIFAKSSHADDEHRTTLSKDINYQHDDEDERDPPNQKETVLLGTVYTLETPLKFHGNVLPKRNYDVSVSSVKLLDPGSKHQEERLHSDQLEDDVAKWKNIIKHDYQLIIRGNMRYKIPYGGGKSVPVQSQTEVKASP